MQGGALTIKDEASPLIPHGQYTLEAGASSPDHTGTGESASTRACPLSPTSLSESSRGWLETLVSLFFPSTSIGGPTQPSSTWRRDLVCTMKLWPFACLLACFVGAWVPVVHAQGTALSHIFLAPVFQMLLLYSTPLPRVEISTDSVSFDFFSGS